MGRTRTVSLKACAKINLGLQILGKRQDGYHDLITIFQTVDLADELTVRLQEPGLHMAADGFDVPEDENNLCIRAAGLYFEVAGKEPVATIQLTKNIPVGAGLGGGSSDAAATICALDRLLDAGVDLQALASAVGSDVAFFLQGGTALGTGRGEQIVRSPQSAAGDVVLAKPDLSISTKTAYGLLGSGSYSDGAKTRELFDRLQQGACLLDCAALLVNDFERVIEGEYPQVRRLRQQLLEAGAAVAMLCGSGSCVFGLFADAMAARRCADDLRKAGYWTYAGKMLNYLPCAAGATRKQ